MAKCLDSNGTEYVVVIIRITAYLRAKLEKNNKEGRLLSLIAVDLMFLKQIKLAISFFLNMTTCALVFLLPAFQRKLLSPTLR